MLQTIGISTALLTPFDEDGAINHEIMSAHASWVLSEGVSSVTLFGTTGEGASVSPAERIDAVGALLASGIAAEKNEARYLCGLCQ